MTELTAEFKAACSLMRSRKSIYPVNFTGEKISDSVIWELLENANTAPTHRKTEPWRFHVLTGSSLDKFTTFCESTYKQSHQAEAFKQRKYAKIRRKLERCSHLLIISMKKSPPDIIPEWEEIAAVSCAVQNIYLSLGPAGLGGYWSSPAWLISKISDFVTLTPDIRCLGFFYLGIPQLDTPISERSTIKEKVVWLD